MSIFYNKLLNASKSLLWFLGFAILLFQTFRIAMFYGWGWDFEIDLTRDIFVACLGVTFMFLQNPLKASVKGALNKIGDLLTKKK